MACQRAKVQRHVRAPWEPYPPTTYRFEHVNIDLIGPLPPSQEHRFLLTMVDRFASWSEAVPIKDATTLSYARAFISHWVARFGIPSQLSSNRGAQSTSEVWSAMTKLLGIRLHHTSAYHPQANGLVERLHRQLKSALIARMKGPD